MSKRIKVLKNGKKNSIRGGMRTRNVIHKQRFMFVRAAERILSFIRKLRFLRVTSSLANLTRMLCPSVSLVLHYEWPKLLFPKRLRTKLKLVVVIRSGFVTLRFSFIDHAFFRFFVVILFCFYFSSFHRPIEILLSGFYCGFFHERDSVEEPRIAKEPTMISLLFV